MKEILAIIPARGGSSRVPRKNILPILGRPLIACTIHQAKKSQLITRVIVSTDDEEIAKVARQWGAEVPFMRPKELAENLTPDLPVFVHALQRLEEHEGYRPEIIVHLRPTTPTRRAGDIDAAVKLLIDQPQAHSVRSVLEPPQSPYKMYTIAADGFLKPLLTLKGVTEAYNLPQQSLPAAYMHRGAIDVIRRETILEMNSMTGANILPYILRGGYASLNTFADLAVLEAALRSGEWDIPQ